MTLRKHTRRIGIILAALAAVAAVASGGAAAADPADVEVVQIGDPVDINESGPLPDGIPDAAAITVRNTTSSGTLTTTDVSFSPSNGASVNKFSTFPSEVTGSISASDIPDDGEISVDVTVDGTTIKTVNLSKIAYNTDSVSINKSLSTDVQSITLEIDGSEVDGTEFATSEPPKAAPTYGNYTLDLLSDTGSTPYGSFVIDNSTTATVTETLKRSELTSYEENSLNRTFNSTQTPTNTTLYIPDSVETVKIDGTTVYDPGPLGGTTGGSSSQRLLLVVVAGAAAILLLND